MPYIDPTEESGRALFSRRIEGPVVMLNLMRFHALANYSAHPALAPAQPISGAAAYDRYVAHTLPFLTRSGGAVLFDGDAAGFLVGPSDEIWDRVLLIRQASLAAFLAFARDPDYLAGLGHRTAALADSRLLPIVPRGA